MEVKIVQNEEKVIDQLWKIIEKSSNEAIQENSVFRVGLSGGSLIKYLANGAENSNTDWSKWQLYFCDERFVDETNEDSTFGQYKKLLIPKTKLTESQFVIINRSLSLEDCAKDYERQIFEKFGLEKVQFQYETLFLVFFITNFLPRRLSQFVTFFFMILYYLSIQPEVPKFDLLLLGMGPDGHTCSLFPGHPLLEEKTLLIAPISDSPKPPPERVTMTYPLINNAKLCLFPISGKGKAEMVKVIPCSVHFFQSTKEFQIRK